MNFENPEDAKNFHNGVLMMLRLSGLDIPAPEPHINSVEGEILSKEGKDVWLNVQIELSRLGKEDIKGIIRLICMKHLSISECLGMIRDKISEDTTKTLQFLKDHDEFQLSREEVMKQMGIGE